MSTDPTLLAQNTPPRRSSSPSLVPDEWGGSDLANPEWSRIDFEAAKANVQLIRQIVTTRGGNADETAGLVGDALRRMSERGPFGHVGNAFLYGATQELLERATAMSPADFNHYLRNLETKQNPLNIFERTALDQLTDDAKRTTQQHIQQSRGEQSFRLFGAMEGQNGPLAFSAGAADAVAEEYGRGARDLLVIAANPLEAGRQFTNLVGSVDRLPQAVQEAYRQLQTEIGRWGESDYRKGYLTAQAVITALDVRDAAESIGRLGTLAGELRAGRIQNLSDAMDVLEHGRPRNRTDVDTPGNNAPGNGRPGRLPDTPNRTPDPVQTPDLSTPAGRQRLPQAEQAALITNAFRLDGALGREMNNEILRWSQRDPNNRIENLYNSPQLLYGRGDGRDVGLMGEAFLKAGVPEADRPAARRALGDLQQAMAGRSGDDIGRLYRNLMDPQSSDRAVFDRLVDGHRRGVEIDRQREGSVGNAVVIDANGRPQRVSATARLDQVVYLESGGQTMVAELRRAVANDGKTYVGWGTNERFYPFRDGDGVVRRDGSLDLDAAQRTIINHLNNGSAQRDALVTLDAWNQRRVDAQREGSVGNAVVFDASGNPQRVTATARTDQTIDIDIGGRPFVAEIRRAVAVDGNSYIGWGTNDRFYPFDRRSGAINPDGSVNREAATRTIVDSLNNGSANRDALVTFDAWQQRRVDEARLGSVGNAVVMVDGNPQRVTATAGTGVAVEVVGADRQRFAVEIREAEIAGGQRYLGFGTNNQWYPFPQSANVLDAGGNFNIDRAREYILEQARAGNVNRGAMVPKDQWDVSHPPPGGNVPDNALGTPSPNPPGNNVPGNNAPGNNAPGNNTPGNNTPDPVQGNQNRLPPASQPDDPLLPYHAVPRDDRLKPPQPMVVGGRSYDVMGMTDAGELRLRPPTDNVRTVPDNAMFVLAPTTPADLQPGARVVHAGRDWRLQGVVEPGQAPGVNERSYRLVDPLNDSATAIVPASRANEIFKRNGREVTYDERQWEFGAATGRGYVLIDPANRDNTVTVPLDQADRIRMRFAGGEEYTLQGLKNGVLRVAPSDPSGDIGIRPQPGDTFEARLRGRELEGVYTITVGENGALTAAGRNRSGVEVNEPIRPADIAPRYVNVDSPDFGQPFQVDAFFHAEATTRARSIATEPTGLPIRDPNLGTLPDTTQPRVLRGVEALDAQADFIRTHANRVPDGGEPRLTVFNIGFSNQGEAQRVVDAMVEFRQQHPDARIEVVAERARFESASRAPGYDAFLQTLRDNNIQLNFFENGNTSREVIHAKGVIVNDQVLFTTGAVIDGSKNKVDIATELPPEAAQSFIRFFDQGLHGNADRAERQQLLADMARQGVLVDDSVTRTPYISRTQDALINGAQDKLFISLSDLTNPDTTRAIFDRVRNGVQVEIQYREIDPRSREMLNQMQQQYPDRVRVENISNWEPRPHYNVIVADDRQAYVGTSYLWPNQQQQIHHTRSFENGVLLQGGSVRTLVDQLEDLRRSQQQSPQSRAPDSPAVAEVARIEPIAARPPQPGEPGFETYQRSRNAVEQLNAGLNLSYGESSEKLTVAAAGVALQQRLRVDEVALSPPSATLAGGSTAFVIERGATRESDRYGSLSMQVAMQTPLEEGYRRLGEIARQQNAQIGASIDARQQPNEPEPRANAPRIA